jgi:hypothetical protein
MKSLSFILLVVLTSVLCTGCASSDPATFKNQVHHWVPLGTPVAEAQRIMEHHHFQCDPLAPHPENPSGDTTLSCRKKSGVLSSLGDWQAELIIRDGKVVGYGYIDL